MNIQYFSPQELIPYENNAKAHDKKQINNVAMSIKKYGFQQPIVVDQDMVIIIGHCRHLAALKLGLDVVPVVIAEDLTPDEVAELRLVDNKSNESDWLQDMLKIEIPTLPGLDDFDFDWGLPEELGPEAVDDDFDEELPEEPKSKLGDLYRLGKNRLMCGSSTDPEQVKKLMGGELADMLLTDPPYGVDYEGGTGMKIENDKLAGEEFLHFLADAFDAADQVMKPGAVFYIWHADSNGNIFRNACDMVGWQVRQCLIWVKNSLVMGRQDYQWKHEPCLYGWKDGASHLWASDRKQTTVLEFDKPKKNDIHPTMKPVPLFDYQMKNNTKGGDIVLDLFGGSGTTIIAAEQNGRRGYCMELDPKYVDVIIDRWEALTGEEAVLINNDGTETPWSQVGAEAE